MSDMGSALQENVLTLLCFNAEHAPAIVNNVSHEQFDNEIYADIAKSAIKYHRKYNRPVAEHLPDVLEKKLSEKGKLSRDYRTIIEALSEYKERVNPVYVMGELENFVRAQEFKKHVKKAVEFYQADRLDAAEMELSKLGQVRVNTFEPGIFFGNPRSTLAFLHHEDHLFSSGIEQLDELGISPARGELYVFVALPGYGKSWAMIHCAKMNLLQRTVVVYITLEMSQDKISMRLIQSLFAVSKSSSETFNTNLVFNEDGVIRDLEPRRIEQLKHFQQPNIERVLVNKLERTRFINKLIIKQFPTGQLTMEMLKAYLENLSTFYHIFPDMLIIDYADLMHIDSAHLRVDTGKIYKDLRGLAVQYGIAIVTASQANRAGEGEGIRLLTRKNLAEDFSKVAIADNVITYNQTAAELERGLARLYVDKARNDRRGDIILLSQNYGIGQFCLQSTRLNRVEYGNMLAALTSRGTR